MAAYNLEVENKVIQLLLVSETRMLDHVLQYGLDQEHFADLFLRDAFRCLRHHWRKYGALPTVDTAVDWMRQNYTSHSKYTSPDRQVKVWISRLLALFARPIPVEPIQPFLDLLERLRKARLLEATLMEVIEMQESEKYEDAFLAMQGSIQKSKAKDLNAGLTEGELVSDLKEHLHLIDMKQKGLIKPLHTHFRGVRESADEQKFYRFKLDDVLAGGFYNGDLAMIFGHTGDGKSFSLMEFCYLISRFGKKNVMLATIEMGKLKQQMRAYSRITGIDYRQLRTGEINAQEQAHLKKCMAYWKENCGIFHVTAFDKGATASDIQAKLDQACNHYKVNFDFLAIDYLTDMRAESESGDKRHGKDWSVLGEISWSLASLAKSWNQHQGISIMSANQKRTTTSKKESTSWDDGAFSSVIAHHTAIGLGIDYNKETGKMRWDIWKNRDAESGVAFYTFPDFAKCRVHSKDKMQEILGADIMENIQ